MDGTNKAYDTDKRRYVRYEILDYGVVYTPDAIEPLNAVIVNIGLGGLQARTRAPLPVGVIVEVQVGRENDRPLVLRGEVRHASVMENSDLFSSGIRFTPTTHDERISIAEYVHSVFQRQCDLLES